MLTSIARNVVLFLKVPLAMLTFTISGRQVYRQAMKKFSVKTEGISLNPYRLLLPLFSLCGGKLVVDGLNLLGGELLKLLLGICLAILLGSCQAEVSQEEIGRAVQTALASTPTSVLTPTTMLHTATPTDSR